MGFHRTVRGILLAAPGVFTVFQFSLFRQFTAGRRINGKSCVNAFQLKAVAVRMLCFRCLPQDVQWNCRDSCADYDCLLQVGQAERPFYLFFPYH